MVPEPAHFKNNIFSFLKKRKERKRWLGFHARLSSCLPEKQFWILVLVFGFWFESKVKRTFLCSGFQFGSKWREVFFLIWFSFFGFSLCFCFCLYIFFLSSWAFLTMANFEWGSVTGRSEYGGSLVPCIIRVHSFRNPWFTLSPLKRTWINT